jgi:phage-related protein
MARVTRLLNITPGYPLKYREKFRTLKAENPSGVTMVSARWAYGRKEWELTWPGAVRTTETDTIRDILNECRGGNESFYWKEPNQTSRNRVYIGKGTGTRSAWTMPCKSFSALSVRVGTFAATSGTHFQYTTGTLDTITFAYSFYVSLGVSSSFIPTSGTYVECDYTNGNLMPLVRLRGDFSHSLRSPGDRGDISITIAETKEQ